MWWLIALLGICISSFCGLVEILFVFVFVLIDMFRGNDFE